MIASTSTMTPTPRFFEELLKIITSRREYVPAATLKKILMEEEDLDFSRASFFLIVDILDFFLFKGKLSEILEDFDVRLVHSVATKKDELLTLKMKASTKCITLHVHQSIRRQVDGIKCNVKYCMVLAWLHEFTHIIEFLVRYQLQTKIGYSKKEEENVIFIIWKAILFGF